MDLDTLLSDARVHLSHTGLQISSLSYSSQTLTVFIKHAERNATLDDCAQASSLLGDFLEDTEYLDDSYTLEVSTPGAGEVLEAAHEFAAFRGFPVCVRTRELVKGKQFFYGSLGDCDECIRISKRGRAFKFEKADVAEVRLCTAGDVENA